MKKFILFNYFQLFKKINCCVIAILCCSTTSFAQGVNVSINEKNITIKELLNQIEEDIDYSFAYAANIFDLEKKVNVTADNKNVEAVLLGAIPNIDLKFDGKKIIILAKKSAPKKSTQQREIITGVVSDENGNPLTGVVVTIKGTSTGDVTKVNGEYSLSVAIGEILLYQFIGYKTLEIKVGTESIINPRLEVEGVVGDEVVVVGYGIMRKSDVSASITSISGADLEEQPIVKATDALQGKIPGVSITGQTGSPGSAPVIRIRGANSISSSNDPLIVIDGFMGGSLSTINPSDIQSMDILKDASATAIYGSRGANGVILITTKSGTTGKTEVDFNSFVGFQTVTKKIETLGALEYAETVNMRRSVGKENNIHATEYDSKWWYFSQESLDKLANGEMHVNWQDEVYETALMQNYQISLKSGTERSQVYSSMQYTDQDGIIMNSGYKKFSGRVKADFDITNKIRFGANVFFARETNNPTNDYTTSSTVNALPTGWIYKEDGSYFNNRESYGGWGESSPNTASGLWNPVAQALETVRDIYTTSADAITYLEYNDIIDGLSLKVNASARLSDVNDNGYYNGHTRQGWGQGSIANIADNRGYGWQNSNVLSYRKIFGDHSLNVTALFEQQYEQWSSNSIEARGFINDSKLYHDIASAETVLNKNSSATEYSLLSYMGRVNYSYKNKYIFTGAIRSDGSSKFGENNKWGYFPSASAAWRINEEDFLKHSKNVSDLKLRASWGVTGNQGINPYETMSKLGMGGSNNYPLNGNDLVVGSSHMREMSNKDLKWEKTNQIDIGLDLSLFNHRLSFVLDYYHKKTTDLLLNVPLPEYTGYYTVRANVGSVENKGFEFLVSGRPFVGAFQWDVAFNISANRNKVLSISAGTENRMSSGGLVSYVIEGQPLGSFYGYDYLGVFLPGEEAEAAKYGQNIGSSKIRDVNNDGKFDQADKTIIGDPNPKFLYGFSNKFSYKNFDLNIFIQGSYGNDIFNAAAEQRYGYETTGATGYRNRDRWHPTHMPNGYYERYDYAALLDNSFHRNETVSSNIFVEDGSYLRLKNVTLSYNLPQNVVKKLKLRGIRVYASADNLLTLDNYWGYDPELGSTNNDSALGVDYSYYPNVKTVMFGLDIRF